MTKQDFDEILSTAERKYGILFPSVWRDQIWQIHSVLGSDATEFRTILFGRLDRGEDIFAQPVPISDDEFDRMKAEYEEQQRKLRRN